LGILLGWLYRLVGNYGISLIILTAIVRTALYPLSARQIKSTARMSKMQPKMKEIQDKYGDDRALYNEKMSELYKEEKYSPTAGCLPLFIQMFILFGLFELLRHPIKYLGNSTELLFAVHESFLWIPDLSQPDKWILPILAAATTFINMMISTKQNSMGKASTGMNGMDPNATMKYMNYVLPVMILLMARTYPAGLAIYWFFGTLVQIAFTFRFGVLRRRILAEYDD